jgi:hypothetical protein
MLLVLVRTLAKLLTLITNSTQSQKVMTGNGTGLLAQWSQVAACDRFNRERFSPAALTWFLFFFPASTLKKVTQHTAAPKQRKHAASSE